MKKKKKRGRQQGGIEKKRIVKLPLLGRKKGGVRVPEGKEKEPTFPLWGTSRTVLGAGAHLSGKRDRPQRKKGEIHTEEK